MSINLILCLNYHIEDVNSHLQEVNFFATKLTRVPWWSYTIKTLNIL